MRFSQPDLVYLVARAHAHTVTRREGRDTPGAWNLTRVVVDAAHPATFPWAAAGDAPGPAKLPSWAEMLNEVLLAAGRVAWDWLDAAPSELARPLDPAAPLAFAEILLPFIYAARAAVRRQSGHSYSLLDGATHRVLERSLLVRLARLCQPALEVAFLGFRTQARLDLAERVAPGEDPARALYSPFVMEMLWGELLPFFTREPLLAQQAALITEGWVATVAALLAGLSTSRGADRRASLTLI
jgi:hypothetical protein